MPTFPTSGVEGYAVASVNLTADRLSAEYERPDLTHVVVRPDVDERWQVLDCRLGTFVVPDPTLVADARRVITQFGTRSRWLPDEDAALQQLAEWWR